MLQQKPTEALLEFQFQPLVAADGEFRPMPTYRLVMFQKQGPEFRIMEYLSYAYTLNRKIMIKSRLFIQFLLILVFFVTLVSCKEPKSDFGLPS